MSNLFIVKSSTGGGGGWPPVETQKFRASYSIGDFQYNNISAESQKFQASYSITTFTYA